uniref:Uncharacterized protein n=1 Tax=Seriola dumerili TaxID=41447 RepID=A0A3B4VNZ3_SERDU
MWKQHLFLIVHVKRIFQSSHLCSRWLFSSAPLHPPAITFFSAIAPYVASQLITQEKLAEDAAEHSITSKRNWAEDTRRQETGR